ncbi:CD206 [Mytilus edulis]|uniref:MRC n=1 Tax=Mytilus edulis TaxID=6550 RepID=A0A8S3QS63_MYTED|nr:CD206 [Mytilus edulis]
MQTSDHTYDEPTDEKGYTQLASISENHQKYDDLKPPGSHHSYFEPQPYHVKKRCERLVAGLTYIVIQSRDNTEVCIKSEDSGNAGFRISKIWTECPNDWKTFDVWCFKEFSEQRTWFQARDYCRKARTFCRNNGSDLVIIGSKEEYNFIISQTTKQHQGADFWIGLQKQMNQTYRWINGSHPTYLAWGIDEPKGDNNECVKSSTMYGNWSLNNNSIGNIPNGTFNGLTRLQNLNLDGNSISDTIFLKTLPTGIYTL